MVTLFPGPVVYKVNITEKLLNEAEYDMKNYKDREG